jgi:cyclase
MDNKYVVVGEAVNASAVFLSEGAIVIDTSVNEELAKELLLKLEGKNVRYVINTHEHQDHIAGNHLFNAPVICAFPASESIHKSLLPSQYQVMFKEEMKLIMSETIIIKHYGGHSPGSAVVYFPNRRLLFSGDLVFSNRIPFMGQADFHNWIQALADLESLEIDTVIPGHGLKGGKEILTVQREWLENFVRKIVGWKRKAMSPDEINSCVFDEYQIPERWHSMIVPAVQRVLEEYKLD